jgi:hypothetical protein
MSTDHRKPAVAFVALAFAAAGLVGVQQADAQGGRFLAGIVGSDAQVRGEIAAQSRARSPQQTALGQAFVAFSRPAAQSTESSRTADVSDQLSRTQDRPPVSETDTPVQREPVSESTIDSTGRGGTSRDEQPSRRAREGRPEPAERGADRRSNRAADHAAAHEKPGSRRGRAGDEQP